MKNLSVHQKLDLILDYYRKNKQLNDTDWQELSKNVGIDLNELQMKLEKDELIKLRDGRPTHQLTIEGQLFEGYVNQRNRLDAETHLNKVQTMVISIGTGAAGLFALIQFFQWICSCQ